MENPIQKYFWGSKTAIQKIMGIEPDGQTPWAELWMGAHPKAASKLTINNTKRPLNDIIRLYPGAVLGEKTAEKYKNTLPYLFKVLAADIALSIQAHPDEMQAKQGFEREEFQKIPISAPHRNYRDPWPKPELICALEPFGALIGFRAPSDICSLARQFAPSGLAKIAEDLKSRPDASGIRLFFNALMTMEKQRQAEIINEAVSVAKNHQSPEAVWIARLYKTYPEDIGILAPIYLNLLEIAPGKAAFLPPGTMHAYLYGTGVEIMANSDNVLRGGLTQKHIDLKELLKIVDFKPALPEILFPRPAGDLEQKFITPAEQFCLSVINIKPGQVWRSPESHSAEILFCSKGRLWIKSCDRNNGLTCKAGKSVLIPAAAGSFEISGNGKAFKAGVPL